MIHPKRLKAIRLELLSNSYDLPLTEKMLRYEYVNVDLIAIMKRILNIEEGLDNYHRILIRLRRLIKQLNRAPHPTILKYQRDEYLQHLSEIKDEQKANEPLNWIEAEIEYILEQKKVNALDNEKPFWSFDDAKRIFNISKNTLHLRISEGMPARRLGGAIIFMPDEVLTWIKEAC